MALMGAGGGRRALRGDPAAVVVWSIVLSWLSLYGAMEVDNGSSPLGEDAGPPAELAITGGGTPAIIAWPHPPNTPKRRGQALADRRVEASGGAIKSGGSEDSWVEKMETAEESKVAELHGVIEELERTDDVIGELDDGSRAEDVARLQRRAVGAKEVEGGLREGDAGELPARDDAPQKGTTLETAEAPFPSAFPGLGASAMPSCRNSLSCESHFFPVFDRHVADLVALEALEPSDARGVACAPCIQFLCCDKGHALDFSRSERLARACPAHCRPLSEDFKALEAYHKKEDAGALDVEWSYLREYLRAVTDVNFKMVIDHQFHSFRQILYQVHAAQSPDLARRMREASTFEHFASGGGSQLYRVMEGKTTYVVKRPYSFGAELPATTVSEINANEVLRWSRNPHFVKYFGYYVTFEPDSGQYVHLVFEYCTGGDLGELWERRNDELRRQPDVVADLLGQMALAMQELSLNRIAHRDLKLDNLFVAFPVAADRALRVGDVLVKLGDFDRAVMWPGGGSSSSALTTPTDDSKRASNLMFYQALEGRLATGIGTVTEYPRELTTIQNNLMPPEALLAAITRLLTADEVERLTGTVPLSRLAELLPNAVGVTTVNQLESRIATMDARQMENHDIWQLGIMSLQLLTGRGDPISDAYDLVKYESSSPSTDIKQHGETLCKPGSPEAQFDAVCYLERQAAVLGDVSTASVALRHLLRGIEDADVIQSSLELIFAFRPERRVGIMRLARQAFLVDALERIEMNDRRMHLQYKPDADEGLSADGLIEEPGRNRWGDCTLLSFAAFPMSLPPSIRWRSVLPVVSFAQAYFLQYTHIEKYPGAPPASVLRGGLPILTPHEDSPYSAMFYYDPVSWNEVAPPAVVPTQGEKIRRDLYHRREISEILARAYPHAAGRRYPEVSYDVDPRDSGGSTVTGGVSFTNIAVAEVRHFEHELDVYEEFGVTSGMFSSKPEIPRSVFGYLVVYVNVDLSFEDDGNRPDAIVAAYAYEQNRLAAAPLGNTGWVRVCNGEPGNLAYYSLHDKGRPGECGNSRDKTVVRRIRLKLLVQGPFVGTWTLRMLTRTRGVPYESCHSVEIVSPLNILDIRWTTVTSMSMLFGKSQRRSVACSACMHEWTLAMRRLAYVMPSESAFVGQSFRCRDDDDECLAASREIRDLLTGIPRNQRSLLLSLGPTDGCRMITNMACREGIDFNSADVYNVVPGAAIANICHTALHDREEDRDAVATEVESMNSYTKALSDFPKCPGAPAYPNVLPSYAPTMVYQGWHRVLGCDMCRFVATTARELWNFGPGKLQFMDVCDMKEKQIYETQHGIYSRLKRVWPSHFIGNYDARVPHGIHRKSSWKDLVKGIAEHTRQAESLICPLPWMEREIQLCRGIQSSLQAVVTAGIKSDSGVDEIVQRLADPTAYCQDVMCCHAH